MSRRSDWSPYDMPFIVDRMVDMAARTATAWEQWVTQGLTEDHDAVASQHRFHAEFTQAAGGRMIWIDKGLCRMVAETAPTVPTWSPSAVLPAPDGVMLWERSPAGIVWTDEDEELPTTCDGIAWATTGERLVVHFLTRLPGHRDRLSPLRTDSPVVPSTTMRIPLDHPQGAGADMQVHSLTTERTSQAGIAALAAVGATWILMGQERVVEEGETTVRRKPRQDRPGTITRPVVAVSEHRLRRQVRPSKGGGRKGERHSSSRWWVRGHWRQQPHGPKRALRKPVFIEPHTAGPAGAPLDSRPKVERWKP